MCLSISDEKKRFLFLTSFIMSSKPGSLTGKSYEFELFHASILDLFESTTVISTLGHFKAITAIVGVPT